MQSKLGHSIWRATVQRRLPMSSPWRAALSTAPLLTYSDPFPKDLVSNHRLTKFEIEFLGSGSLSSKTRFSSSVMLHLDRNDTWLFDAPDGTLRECQICTQRNYCKMRKIFISSFTSDTFLGLPNLLISRLLSSPQQPYDKAPVEIYGPPGIIDFLQESLSWAMRGHVAIPWQNLTVYEMALHSKQVEILQQTSENDFPWTNGPFEQLGLSPIEEPKQGQEYLFAHHRIYANEVSGYWQLFGDDKCTIVAGLVGSTQPTFGFVFKENNLHGNISREKLAELRNQYYLDGDTVGQIKAGGEVVVKSISKPHTETVLTPNDFGVQTVTGRKLCVVNSGTDASHLAAAAKGCDALIHPVTVDDKHEKVARLRGYSTPRLAINAAVKLDAQCLLISRLPFGSSNVVSETESRWTKGLSRSANHLHTANDRVIVRVPFGGYNKDHTHLGLDVDFSRRAEVIASSRNLSSRMHSPIRGSASKRNNARKVMTMELENEFEVIRRP